MWVHSSVFQLVLQQNGLDGVESTGELTEHDPHNASSCFQVGEGYVEEVDYGVVNSHDHLTLPGLGVCFPLGDTDYNNVFTGSIVRHFG